MLFRLLKFDRVWTEANPLPGRFSFPVLVNSLTAVISGVVSVKTFDEERNDISAVTTVKPVDILNLSTLASVAPISVYLRESLDILYEGVPPSWGSVNTL